MKIDEGCINHNALRLIDEAVRGLCDYCDANEELDHVRLVTFGYIGGVLDMAKELKGVLKA